MKHINFIKLIIPVVILFSITACDKQLNIEPIGSILKVDALQTEEDLKALLNSCYTVLASDKLYGGRLQIMNELLSDEIDGQLLSGDYGEIFQRKTSIFGDFKNQFYAEPYISIYRANNVLENLSLASTDKDNIEGQAKFIRAICHFELVRLFAQPYGFTSDNSHPGIPLRLESKPSGAVRASVKEVYEQIIKDLKEAELLLADANGNLPTKWSAKGMLARVYFQMNNFVEAYSYANQVITSNKFQFQSDLSKRFSLNGSSESVFLLVYESGNSRFGALRGDFRSDVNLPTLKISQSSYNAANANTTDARKAWYNNTKYADNIVINKYNLDKFQLPVLHLTELKLIRAESAGELNQNIPTAVSDLNDIRQRAYGSSVTPLSASSSAALVVSTARSERQLEMVAEGDRVQQLKRIGAKGENIQIRNAPWNCPGMILQFSQGEISNSPNFLKNPEGGCN